MKFKDKDIIILPEKREVLFEKFVGEKLLKQIEMKEFFYNQLNNCEIKILKNYPSSVFFIKKGKYIFEIFNGQYFHGNNHSVWSVFYNKFKLDYADTQCFIERQIINYLAINDYIAVTSAPAYMELIENQI